MAERGGKLPIDASIEEAILGTREASRQVAPEVQSPSIGAANPGELQSAQKESLEIRALSSFSRGDLEVAHMDATDRLAQALPEQREKAQRELDAASEMLERLDAATKRKNAASNPQPTTTPDTASTSARAEELRLQREQDMATVQEQMAQAQALVAQRKANAPEVLPAADVAPFQAKAIENGIAQKAASEDGKIWNPETFQLIDAKEPVAPVGTTGASTMNEKWPQEELPLGDSWGIPYKANRTKTASSGEAAVAPESRAEKKEVEQTSETLTNARERYASCLRSLKKWNGFAKSSEIDVARTQYIEQVATALTSAVRGVKKKYEGQDLNNPELQTSFQADLLRVTMDHRMAEEQVLRESMRDGQHRRLLDGARTFWKKHAMTRLVIGGTLTGVGVATRGTPISGLAFAARGILTGASMGVTLDAAGQKIRKDFGDTRELKPEYISKLRERSMSKDQKEQSAAKQEIERLVSAHTLQQVDDGVQEFGVQDRGILKWKHKDETGKQLLEMYDDVVRSQLEQEIAFHVNNGKSIDDIISLHIGAIGGEREVLHGAYIKRIKSNKKWNAIIAATSTIGGIALGSLGFTGAMKAGQHAADLSGHAHESKEHAVQSVRDAFSKPPIAGQVELQGATQDTTTTDFHNPFLPDTSSAAAHTAVEVGKTAAAHIEIAKAGDSVWSLTDRFVTETFPNLSPEQKTWMVDSIKDTLAAHPELVGLKDINHLTAGAAINFDNVGIDYAAIAGKATVLSQEVTNGIHEHLASHADHVVSATEQGSSVASSISSDIPRAVRDIPVLYQDDQGRLVELGQHMQESASAALPTSEWMNPSLASALEHFKDARSVWETEVTPGTLDKWLGSLGQMTVAEAGKPGVLEATFARIGSNDQMVEAKMAEAIRDMIRSLSPEVVAKSSSVGEVLTKVTIAGTK